MTLEEEASMGHSRVGVLPETPRWKQVRAIVDGGASASAAIEATLRAAVEVFGDADAARYGLLAREPGAWWSCWILMTVPAAARDAPSFREALAAEHGIALSGDAWKDHVNFIAHLTNVVRERSRREEAGNFSELALSAVRETLTRTIGSRPAALFAQGPDAISSAWAEYGTHSGFARLAGVFLSRLLFRTVNYYLSKELPQHVGPNRRFASMHELAAYEGDVEAWATERARIAEQFSREWISKQRFARGKPTFRDARNYLSYALAKVGSEVQAHQAGT